MINFCYGQIKCHIDIVLSNSIFKEHRIIKLLCFLTKLFIKLIYKETVFMYIYASEIVIHLKDNLFTYMILISRMKSLKVK